MNPINPKNPTSPILRSIINRPGRVLLSFGVLLIIAVLVTGLLEFEKDIFKLLPKDNPAFNVLVHAMKRSAAKDRLYILLEPSRGGEDLMGSAHKFTDALRKITVNQTPAFEKITYRKTEAYSEAEFQKLFHLFLEKPQFFLTREDQEKFSGLVSSGTQMEVELKKSLALIAMPGGGDISRMAATDPFNFRSFIFEKLKRLHRGFTFAPGPYLLSMNKKFLLVIATPSKAVRSPVMARRLLDKLAQLRLTHTPLTIGYTGGFVLAAQEEALIRGDITGCLIGSVIAISLFLSIVYRNFYVLVFFMIPLAAGIQLSMGAMVFFCDRIHMLALAFTAVILGLGIDFAVHLYDRYISERQKGQDRAASMHAAVFNTGAAVLVGGLTTLSVFVVITLGDNPVLFQIGWLVAYGLLFCLLTILWALPACLIWVERFTTTWLNAPPRVLGMDRMGRWVARYPKRALWVTAAVFALSLPGLSRVTFEQDPMALKPRKLEAVSVQQNLLTAFAQGNETVMVAWPADSPEDFWEKTHRMDQMMAGIHKDGGVSDWVSLGRLASQQLAPVTGFNITSIEALLHRYDLSIQSFGPLKTLFEKLHARRKATEFFLANTQWPDSYPDIYHPFFIREASRLQGVGIAHVPSLKAAEGLKQHLLQLSPELIVVNPRMAMDGLVKSVQNNFRLTVGIAGTGIFIILLGYFRKISAVLLVLSPVTLGCLTTVGLMGWSGMHLNFFNFIVLPVLIGIGIDDGIHIVSRYREIKDVELTLATTGRSILMTTLTTVFGFGSLYLADYHVLESMGLLAAVGVMACFLYSTVGLTAVLKIMKPRL